jgi:DNA-3-methyladenine glycosylase II
VNAQAACRAEGSGTALAVAGPFDLALSLKAAASFLPAIEPAAETLTVGLYIAGRPAIIEIRQSGARMEAIGPAFIGDQKLREIAARLVNAGLDLRPFYRVCAGHRVMRPVAESLRGLKPLRPPSLFEMLVIAITEQQLSLAAAFHIRRRLVERFGRPVDALWLFPEPGRIAQAPLAALKECGLSARKAEYVRAIAEEITAGRLDLAALDGMPDSEVRGILSQQRGLGEWSIDYFLARGLGRPDCLPAGDVGLRRVVGRYLAEGARLSADELKRVLASFTPYRSLAAYYLAVHWRLFRVGALPHAPHPSRRSRHEPSIRFRAVQPRSGARGARRGDLRR